AELGLTLPWDAMSSLRARMFAEVPHLAAMDQVPEKTWTPLEMRDMGVATFRNAFEGFYLTNPIARASKVMGELAAIEADRAKMKLAAE
ncbi:MAG: NADH-quinone oxidoreductase subunit G, partial [Candidatus Saccharibacteria bacterium]|nr:NADH-quinone oxidoreductase subunit G [Pseudorhodobacter sp.]